MSPLRSIAGPATVRMPTPSSLRTMYASDVLPRPGGPASSTWSSASPRSFAASSAIESCSLTRSWPTKSSSARGRSERSSSSSSGLISRSELRLMPPAQRLAHLLLGRELGIDAGERALGVERRDSRARRARRAPTRSSPARGASTAVRRASPSARARRAAPSSCRCRESPRSAPCPRARSRAAARSGSSRRRSRARPSARRR